MVYLVRPTIFDYTVLHLYLRIRNLRTKYHSLLQVSPDKRNPLKINKKNFRIAPWRLVSPALGPPAHLRKFNAFKGLQKQYLRFAFVCVKFTQK